LKFIIKINTVFFIFARFIFAASVPLWFWRTLLVTRTKKVNADFKCVRNKIVVGREAESGLPKASVQRSRGQWLQVLLTREIDRAAFVRCLLTCSFFFCFFYTTYTRTSSALLSRRQVSLDIPRWFLQSMRDRRARALMDPPFVV